MSFSFFDNAGGCMLVVLFVFYLHKSIILSKDQFVVLEKFIDGVVHTILLKTFGFLLSLSFDD